MVLERIRNQRGSGMIGCAFMIAVIAAAMYAGFQFGIPKLRHNSFEERVTETYAGNLQQVSAPDVQKQIIQMAADFDIALTPAQVKVKTDNNRITLDVTYEKLIDLKVWQKTMVFTLHRSPAI